MPVAAASPPPPPAPAAALDLLSTATAVAASPSSTPAADELSSTNFVKSYTSGFQGTVQGGGPKTAVLTENLLHLQSLAAVDALAVCNDGSPGAYFFQASATGSSLWIVYLQGGMWCWDQASCQARFSGTDFEMSSTNWPATEQVGGIFSTSKANGWKDANKVYLSYCSSDAWVGDVPASPATYNFAFRGQRIIAATFADLIARWGLDGSANVLFGGCSAGARGAMFNLDYVQAMLPAGATVKGLLDSALWLDLAPIDSAEVSLQTQTQDVYSLVNPSARIPAACQEMYPGPEGWKCLYGQYRLPFVQTSYYINAAQFDSFQMVYDLGGNAPSSMGQVAFADQFQMATRAALQPAVAGGQAVFSSTCLVHCLTDDTAYFTGYAAYEALGSTIAAALTAWYFDNQTPVDIGQCTGYPCVQQCPNGATIEDLSEATASQTKMADAGGAVAVEQSALAQGTMVNGVWVSADSPAAKGVTTPATASKGSGLLASSVWASRQAGMGFGGSAAGASTALPAGQGYAGSGASTGATAAPAQDDEATSWMTMGRRLLRAGR